MFTVCQSILYTPSPSVLTVVFRYPSPSPHTQIPECRHVFCRVADDGTAKRICWLLTECCLSAHQPAQALDAVRFIEAKFVTKPEDARKKVSAYAPVNADIELCLV